MLSQHHAEDLRGAEIKFSKNSSYAVVHAPNWGQGKTRGYLLFFDKQGKKCWSFDHKGCEARFDVSSDGSAVVLAAGDRLYGLDKDGRIIYEKAVNPGETGISVSGDGKYVAVIRKADFSISLLNNQDGNVLRSETIRGFDAVSMILIRETTFFAFGFQGEACTENFFSSGLQTSNSGDLTTTGNFEYCFFDPVGEFSGDDKNIRKSSGLCGIWRDNRSAEKIADELILSISRGRYFNL